MNATQSSVSPADLTVTRVLAALLERLEHSKVAVDAQQYRAVVARLENELRAQASNPQLADILDTHPAAAELYENINYQHAGLCRAALDTALAAEQQAMAVMARARNRLEKGSLDGKN